MLAVLVVFIASFVLTYFAILYSLRKNIIDKPNARSSHAVSKPRGAGIAFVTVFSLILLFYSMGSLLPALLAVAMVGWVDDNRDVSIKTRLMVQLLSMIYLFVYFSFEYIDISLVSFDLVTITLLLLALVSSVWFINLFNFMDGIDGIAASEAITTLLFSGLILYFVYQETLISKILLLMSVSALAFLMFNWQPAKAFMGDVGSGFLGIVVVAMTIISTGVDTHMFWVWLILLAVFITDATYTLLVRIYHKNSPAQAHRTHGYQILSRRLQSHANVSILVILINSFWLAPLAFLVANEDLQVYWGLMLAYSPILISVFLLKAGVSDN